MIGRKKRNLIWKGADIAGHCNNAGIAHNAIMNLLDSEDAVQIVLPARGGRQKQEKKQG
jgi:hypothetical protein